MRVEQEEKMVKSLYARKNDERIILCHFNFNPAFDGRALFEELKRKEEAHELNLRRYAFREAGEYLGLSPDSSVLHSSRFPAEHICRQQLLTRNIPYAILWAPKAGDVDWFERLGEDGYIGNRILLYSEQKVGDDYAHATCRVKNPPEGPVIHLEGSIVRNPTLATCTICGC